MNLDYLEELWESLDRTKKLFFTVSLFLVVGAGGYFLLFESIFEEIESNKIRVAKLENKIKKESKRGYLIQIKRLKKDISVLNRDIKRLKVDKVAMENKLKSLNSLLMDNQKVPSILEKILKNSIDFDIDISQISIEDIDEPFFKKISFTKSLQIEGSGDFLNIVKLVRSIEDSQMLLEVKDYVLESNGSVVNFFVDVRFFGAKL